MRSTADHGASGRPRPGRAGFATIALVLMAAVALFLGRPLVRHGRAAAAAALGLVARDGTASATPPAVPPTRIGMNAPAIRYYGSAVPFRNLAMGSDWLAADWKPLPPSYQDAAGDIVAPPPGGIAQRFLSIPLTGPGGMEVVCTFTGSGALAAFGNARATAPAGRPLRFKVTRRLGEKFSVWIVAKGIVAGRPMRGLDCRDATTDPGTVAAGAGAIFRPAFLDTLRGYAVIRFMDWQNANANAPVTWATRHPAGSIRQGGDGVAIEDMLALTRAVDADPWFVVPWNADRSYVAGFAALVARTLPADRHVYVEVGNEVWNPGFPVSQQAAREGAALGTTARERTMRRYAQRTAEVMTVWERAFANRRGLVRVLSAQHVVPDSARIALTFGDTAAHVDALATAPYFGALIGGTGFTADAMFARLDSDLTATMAEAVANRAIAARYGKRYVAYEGGQGLILPADLPLQARVQSDERMYALYKRFLRGWKAEIGDLLCLLTSTAPISSHGAWGLTEYEGQPPAQAPKLRAVLEER